MKVLVHHSGRKTIVVGDSNSVRVDISDKNIVDKVERVYQMADMSEGELSQHMQNPQDLNVNRYTTKELHDHEYRE